MKSEKKNGKKLTLVCIAILAAVCIATGIAGFSYVNSAPYQSGKKIKLAKKYLEEMQYDKAVASFQEALTIDPMNGVVTQAIEECIEFFCEKAEEYAEIPDYVAQAQIAVYILELDEDNTDGLLIKAGSEYREGNYEAALDIYEEVIQAEPENKDAIEGRDKCKAALILEGYEVNVTLTEKEALFLKELLTLCEKNAWEKILKLLEDEAFQALIMHLSEMERIICRGSINVIIGESEGKMFVYCSEAQDDNSQTEVQKENQWAVEMNGTGVIVISGDDTYTVYEGDFSENQPNGKGSMQIWKKDTQIAVAVVIEGNFADGILDGEVVYHASVSEEISQVALQVDKGSVKIHQVDEKGYLRLDDNVTEKGCALIVKDAEEKEGHISDYIMGIPGFGGSDETLNIVLWDVTPPVMKTGLYVGDGWTGAETSATEFIYAFSAYDSNDGDLSNAIVVDTSAFPAWIPNQVIKGDVVYSVSDAAGNTSSITVGFEAEKWGGAALGFDDNSWGYAWEVMTIN